MEHHNVQHSRLMKWSLTIGIVIVMNLFFNYAISLVYKSPDYNSYFPQTQIVPDITNEQDCVAAGGQWSAQGDGYCDPIFTKQQQYNAAEKQYDRTVFIALVILGVLSIVAGSLLANVVLSLSFSWGGVLSLFIASVRYWSDANSLIKVFILAIALGTLIWVAVKKFA